MERQLQRQLPRNVRQIGNVSDTPKIYVEDYVDTFFSQLCEKAQTEPVGAFLIGEMQETDEEEYVFIHGAIQMHELKRDGKELSIDEDTWKNGYEDCKQYFEDGEIVGWFVARPEDALTIDPGMLKIHRKSFEKKNTVLILKDSLEGEEVYYTHKFNDLMEIGGHYTYYEKNPSMQNYMISSRKRNGVCPSETVEDRVAKDFRSVVRAREEQRAQRRAAKMMYTASAVLILVMLIMGVTTINNFDKLKAVQSALNSAKSGLEETGTDGSSADENGDASEKDEDGSSDETAAVSSGAVTAVTDGSEGTTGTIGQEEAAEGEGNGSDSGNTSDRNGSGNSDVASSGSSSGITNSGTSTGGNGSDGVYVVEKGDTLAIISKKMYGDVSHVDSICRMNGLSDGNLIYIGQKLVLP